MRSLVLAVFVTLLSVTGFAVHLGNAFTTCSNCPVGFGNSNYNLYPYQSSASSYPSNVLDVGVSINQTFSATGYFTGTLFGCTTNVDWTYQNNFFDNSGEFFQQVLAVGLTQATPSCYTVEWGPPGTNQVYNYMAVEVPASYTPLFQSAGNRIDFAIQGTSGVLPNLEVNVTAFNLYLNNQPVATLRTDQMLNATTGQLLKGADGPVFYDPSSGQNFDIVGPGGGQAIVFTAGSGTISYCGTLPQTPPELGGLVGSLGGTVEASNMFYGNMTSSSAPCSYAPTSESQFFNYLPVQGSAGPPGTSNGAAGCDYGAASSGVNINNPTCNTVQNSPSLAVAGNDSLQPGNYMTGLPGQAVGFPCNNGNTANPPGCPAEPQLNFLKAWIDTYNPSAGSFQLHMTVSDLSNLAVVAAPAQGQTWTFQWTYAGTNYFVQMDEWLTNAVSITPPGVSSGPFQVAGVSFWYGTSSVTALNTEGAPIGFTYSIYNYLGPVSATYSATAPGTISFTIPTASVGNPSKGSVFTGLAAYSSQVYGTYNNNTGQYFAFQQLNSPDAIYQTLPYSLGAPLLPNGYVQVAVLPGTQTPSSTTQWTPASQVNYPASNNWQLAHDLSGSTGGMYTVYASEYNNFTGSAGSATSTTFSYAPTVSLSLNPSSGSVRRGNAITTTATVSGGIQTVYLTASTLPAGVSLNWSANPVTSLFSGTHVTITLYTSHRASRGTFSITITAIGADGNSASANYQLTIS